MVTQREKPLSGGLDPTRSVTGSLTDTQTDKWTTVLAGTESQPPQGTGGRRLLVLHLHLHLLRGEAGTVGIHPPAFFPARTLEVRATQLSPMQIRST